MVEHESSKNQKLFYHYAWIIGVRNDEGLLSDEKHDRLYSKLLEWFKEDLK